MTTYRDDLEAAVSQTNELELQVATERARTTRLAQRIADNKALEEAHRIASATARQERERPEREPASTANPAHDEPTGARAVVLALALGLGATVTIVTALASYPLAFAVFATALFTGFTIVMAPSGSKEDS